MPHENSETLQGRDGRWYNVNGETRDVLVPMFSFEAASYDTMEAADAAAKRRSDMFGQGQPSVPGEGPPTQTRFRVETLAEDILREYGLGPPKGIAPAFPPRVSLPGTLPLARDPLLEGLRGPLNIDIAGRREPRTLSDAIPLAQQARFPGAFEPVTSREEAISRETQRLMDLNIPSTYRPGLLPPIDYLGGATAEARLPREAVSALLERMRQRGR